MHSVQSRLSKADFSGVNWGCQVWRRRIPARGADKTAALKALGAEPASPLQPLLPMESPTAEGLVKPTHERTITKNAIERTRRAALTSGLKLMRHLFGPITAVLRRAKYENRKLTHDEFKV